MNMKPGRSAVVRRNESNTDDLMRPIDREQQRVGGHRYEVSRARDHGTGPHAPDKEHVPDHNVLLPRELLDAVRNQVSVFESQNEYPADCSLGSLYLASSNRWFAGAPYPSTRRSSDREA